MTLLTLILMIFILFLTKDDDVFVVVFVSAFFFLTDYLFWSAGSPYYYERHINKDLLLLGLCLAFGRINFLLAGLTCAVSVCILFYEAIHPYQTFITPYFHTIQLVLMQLYLIALTYKSEWRKVCRKQQKM